MPARLRLSWGMKTLKLFLLPVLDSLEFGWRVIRYALIFVSAFFRQRATGAPGKIHSWKGMEAPYGESCWIT